jgi:hypothetical protein
MGFLIVKVVFQEGAQSRNGPYECLEEYHFLPDLLLHTYHL